MNYLLDEEIRYAINNSYCYINYIEGDSIKKISKDIDFYYNGIKYYTTIVIINDSKYKYIVYNKYDNVDPMKYEQFDSFEKIIPEKSNELDETIFLMYELADFTKKEIALINVINFDCKKKK